MRPVRVRCATQGRDRLLRVECKRGAARGSLRGRGRGRRRRRRCHRLHPGSARDPAFRAVLYRELCIPMRFATRTLGGPRLQRHAARNSCSRARPVWSMFLFISATARSGPPCRFAGLPRGARCTSRPASSWPATRVVQGTVGIPLFALHSRSWPLRALSSRRSKIDDKLERVLERSLPSTRVTTVATPEWSRARTHITDGRGTPTWWLARGNMNVLRKSLLALLGPTGMVIVFNALGGPGRSPTSRSRCPAARVTQQTCSLQRHQAAGSAVVPPCDGRRMVVIRPAPGDRGARFPRGMRLPMRRRLCRRSYIIFSASVVSILV